MISDPLEIGPGFLIPASDLEWEFSRSGGPGGQAVNTTDSRARLRFRLSQCDVLQPAVKRRLLEAHPGWATSDGDLMLSGDEHRSRHQNVDAVKKRLVDAIIRALTPPRERFATRPTRSSQRERVEKKKARSTIKSGRGKVRGDD